MRRRAILLGGAASAILAATGASAQQPGRNRIFRGANPGDLPIQLPVGFDE